MDPQHTVQSALDELGQMRVGAEAAVGHEHVTRCQFGMHLLDEYRAWAKANPDKAQ